MGKSAVSRWNPLRGLARSWGHFVRRPRGTQIRTLVLVGVVLAATVAWVAAAPSSASTSPLLLADAELHGQRHGWRHPGEPSQHVDARGDQKEHQRGVPGGVAEFAGRPGGIRRGCRVRRADQGHPALRQSHQPLGGINGRKINRHHHQLRSRQRDGHAGPVQDLDGGLTGRLRRARRPRCMDGRQPVVHRPGGSHPFIGQWTTVTNWTNEGSPYLWWTGPDQAPILQAVVNWGLSADLIGGTIKVGVIAGNRASDQLALNDYLLPALARAGVTPVVKTIDADPSDTATTDSQAPLVVQQFRSDGVTSIIPLIPFNDFYPVLQARDGTRTGSPNSYSATTNRSIQVALGLLPDSLRRRPQRPGGCDHRDARRHRRRPVPEPGRLRPRRAGLLDGRGTRPTPRFHRATWRTSSRSRDRSSAGARPSPCSPRRPAHAGPDLNRRTLRDRHVQDHQLPGHLAPFSATDPTSTTARPNTRWSSCTSTHPSRASASSPRTRSRSSPAGSRSSRSHRCPPDERPPVVTIRRPAQRCYTGG